MKGLFEILQQAAMKGPRLFGILALSLGFLLMPESSLAARSVYTSLGSQCRDTVFNGEPASECDGTGGWRIRIVPEQERTYAVLEKRGYSLSLRDAMFSREIGHFPDLASPLKKSADPQAEWRLDEHGTPYALIFRVYAVDPEKSLQNHTNPYRSRLLVIKLTDTACVAGIVRENAEARNLADHPATCFGTQGNGR